MACRMTRAGTFAAPIMLVFAIVVPWHAARGADPAGVDRVEGRLIVFNDNGAWCWFQDERAILSGGKLIIGSVADASGTFGDARDGNVEVTTYDLTTGATARYVLHPGLGADDHNAPAFLALADGRYLAVYSRHGGDRFVRWRISERPRDSTTWKEEKTFDAGAGVTYSNLFRLSAERGRIYDFFRGKGFDPNFIVSDDGSATWREGGHLLANPGDARNRVRPYLKYASDGVDEIHFIATEAHPQEAASTSIFHGIVKDGKVCASDGSVIGDPRDGPIDPARLTKVFSGSSGNKAWTSDIHIDAAGRPYIAYSVHKSDGDHRYRYARWDGSGWHDREIARAGRRLYKGQEHYTGTIALHPGDPNTVFISTDADPETGTPLSSRADRRRHYEIFRGATKDDGATWTWTPITADSSADNLRPIVPVPEDGDTALLWMRGTYTSYTDYDLDIVGIVLSGSAPR
ncbi:MAG: BNR-4 repeat-containing protein [Planctomycetes bacterium]|nr:BNR-4 repeat-containing protein [Planctomycetota bacterium]